MQKNEIEHEIQQLQATLRRNKEQLANTLTRIFDLEAEIRKKKEILKATSRTKLIPKFNSITH